MTLPFVIRIANQGYINALLEDEHLLNGLNVCKGEVTYEAVAIALDKQYKPAREILE